MLRKNLAVVRSRIAQAAAKRGVAENDIALVCVTKGVPPEQILEVLGLGVKDIGENRVQEALSKYRSIGKEEASWHLIGHLQTNKAKDAVGMFSLIHSVDSERLAKEIDDEARKISKVQDVLVEVNISGEGQRFGISPKETSHLVSKIASYPDIHILGLMGMAPLVSHPEEARPYFRHLKTIFDDLKSRDIGNVEMRHLSMGMSQDFEVAIEEGSNMVRIGSAIFKS